MITQDDIQGHWRRDWLRAPGREDATTCVHWMQVGGVYADIRIPRARPDLGDASCLAALPKEDLAMLAKAEGFAGTTHVRDGVCTWRRVINWHGASDDIDAGRLWFEDGALIEDGVHAEYRELWRREALGPGVAQELSGDGFTAFLVTVGDAFVFAAGTQDAQADAEPVVLFQRFHAFGHWRGDVGVADLATNPFLQGQPVLRRQSGGMLWQRQSFGGVADWVALR